MANKRLPRLSINWLIQPELFRRYWDQIATAIETEAAIDDPITVANLPEAPIQGQRAFVQDALTATFYDIVATGGTFPTPVFYDGTDWRVG